MKPSPPLKFLSSSSAVVVPDEKVFHSSSAMPGFDPLPPWHARNPPITTQHIEQRSLHRCVFKGVSILMDAYFLFPFPPRVKRKPGVLLPSVPAERGHSPQPAGRSPLEKRPFLERHFRTISVLPLFLPEAFPSIFPTRIETFPPPGRALVAYNL